MYSPEPGAVSCAWMKSPSAFRSGCEGKGRAEQGGRATEREAERPEAPPHTPRHTNLHASGELVRVLVHLARRITTFEPSFVHIYVGVAEGRQAGRDEVLRGVLDVRLRVPTPAIGAIIPHTAAVVPRRIPHRRRAAEAIVEGRGGGRTQGGAGEALHRGSRAQRRSLPHRVKGRSAQTCTELGQRAVWDAALCARASL